MDVKIIQKIYSQQKQVNILHYVFQFKKISLIYKEVKIAWKGFVVINLKQKKIESAEISRNHMKMEEFVIFVKKSIKINWLKIKNL